MSDAYDRLVALRPPVPDEAGWPTSPQGRDAFARVRAARPRPPWWRRRLFVVPTVFIGLGAAGVAGVAFASADRDAVADTAVVCVGTTPGGQRSLIGITATSDAAHDVIVAQCNETLIQAGKPVPVDWAECVVPVARHQGGGAEAAVPSDVVVTVANNAAVCQAAGYDPIR